MDLRIVRRVGVILGLVGVEDVRVCSHGTN